MNILLQAIVAISAFTVMVSCVSAINRMTPKTSHVVRSAFIITACGAFGEMASVLTTDRVPVLIEAMFVFGVGVMSMVERRGITRCPFDLTKGETK